MREKDGYRHHCLACFAFEFIVIIVIAILITWFLFRPVLDSNAIEAEKSAETAFSHIAIADIQRKPHKYNLWIVE
ncbi:MAG: hypothetical protein IBX55_00455 [Methyloprofundus sp.]|nr:hypothetical protein [Methyloprofundus sp.]